MFIKKEAVFIGVASGWGGQIRSMEDGPHFLFESGIEAKLQAAGISCHWQDTLEPLHTHKEHGHLYDMRKGSPVMMLRDINLRLMDAVKSIYREGGFPVAITGDHSNAMGVWTGLKKGLPPGGKIGMIWFDAHMDAHTPETTPSEAFHGMPVAALLGYGDPQYLLQKGPVFIPEKTVLIGVRDWEPEEKEFLESKNVRIYYIEEVKERGLRAVVEEAIETVANGTEGFGVSFDMDMMDPEEAPGVGSPAPGGVFREELIPVLDIIGGHPAFQALEMTEYNPHLDNDDKTLKLVREILLHLLQARE